MPNLTGGAMIDINDFDTIRPFNPWMADAWDYWMDRSQRCLLFWDIMRKRGNTYCAHMQAGQPPVLVFDYEMVLDGRTFDEPVNYSLVRILNRRKGERREQPRSDQDRRLTFEGKHLDAAGRPDRPIVVIDPRAGHGPGIGGSKLNSQIGLALDYGHPVYFILFYTDPEPDQTIARVQRAEIRFLETVAQRHPDAPKPAVIGNCQAGWAAALIGADRPDVAGPLVFNGSPLSYWGGVEGGNPMRYRGGLLGGVWLTSLWGDLGAGLFDGAHIVAGFEDLNPANTYWSKYYHLFANVDTEEARFLNFEKWWGGYFTMTAEEMHFIVDSLFIGNELEQGHLTLDDGRKIDLKRIEAPILAFASGGDNITPPPQAFNWIHKVYGSVEEIKRCGQVIIYLVHADIGHLGIFVSGKVASKEHNQILGNMGWLDYLAPGLYEMVVEEGPRRHGGHDYQVRFESRRMEDLLKLDDGLEDEAAFEPVLALSRINDGLYQMFASPWIRAAVTPFAARMLRNSHPLRMQRYMISDGNPGLWPVQWAAETVKAHRRPVASDNPWVAFETVASQAIVVGLDFYRNIRDLYQMHWFKALYENPWVNMMFGQSLWPPQTDESADHARLQELAREKRRLNRHYTKGGFVEACVRIMVAVAGADRAVDTLELKTAEQIIQNHPQLRVVTPQTYKAVINIQSRLLDKDLQRALAGLTVMLPTAEERQAAMAIAWRVAEADGPVGRREKSMLAAIANVLGLAPDAPEP